MNEYGICRLAAVPVRQEPSDRSEMTTQLLFGDLIGVLDHHKGWALIRNHFDGYEGWIDPKQYFTIESEVYAMMAEMPLLVNRSFPFGVMIGGKMSYLPAGCSFYAPDEGFLPEEWNCIPQGELYPFVFNSVEELLKTSLTYLGCPYLWGGRTFMGLDCSGFTQTVFKQHGIKLLRDAARQASQGENIGFISDGRPGDLLFFDHDDGKISHVGILISADQVIHCSGMVRIDTIDHHGIFHSEKKAYTHHLRLINRVIPG